MQIDPIKPTLIAPGRKRLKLNSDIMISILLKFCLNFAFHFNLRRYAMAVVAVGPASCCSSRHRHAFLILVS